MQSTPPASAPPPAPPPPYLQTPRAGWGRFWLGVLAGGCGVLVVEALALVVLLLVVGSAVRSALDQAGGGGLPGVPGLPGVSGLPAGSVPVPPGALSGLSEPSEPCSPQPCVARHGVVVLVGGVDRNAGQASDGRSHLVQVSVTFQSTAGTHTVTPQTVAIRDSTNNLVLPGADSAAARCGPTAVTEELAAGQKAGPYRVCYAVGGSPSGQLT